MSARFLPSSSSQHVSWRRPPAASPRRPGAPASLRAAVEQRLRRNQFVDQYDIRPEVEGTTVTLRGAVSASHEKEKAAEIARGVEGVEQVDNQLLVGDVGDEADVGTMTEPQRRGRTLQ